MTRHGNCPVNHHGRWSAFKCAIGWNRAYRTRVERKVPGISPEQIAALEPHPAFGNHLDGLAHDVAKDQD